MVDSGSNWFKLSEPVGRTVDVRVLFGSIVTNTYTHRLKG